MKLNFKTILIVFLVALLGSSIGTFGTISLYKQNNKSYDEGQLIVNKTEYTNIEKSDLTRAIEKVYDSVVIVECNVRVNDYFYFAQEGTSAGSGVIISQDGYIVTNNHVVSGAYGDDPVKVTLTNKETYSAKIIGTDAKSDLALLKIECDNLPFASLADSSTLTLGQEVIAIGNPLGQGLSVSNGIVSALEKQIMVNNVYLSVIQTNAAINSGNSGGGLFDTSGNLVGIVNSKSSSSSYSQASVEGMGYAIPANTVIKIVDELKANGYVKDRAALGISINTRYSTPIIVAEVSPDSSAAKAGMQAGDIITAIEEVEVNTYADLSRELMNYEVGQTVKVSIIRGKDSLDLQITLQPSIQS